MLEKYYRISLQIRIPIKIKYGRFWCGILQWWLRQALILNGID